MAVGRVVWGRGKGERKREKSTFQRELEREGGQGDVNQSHSYFDHVESNFLNMP